MLPDTGERYLSTPLFEDIGEEMTARGAGAVALDAVVPLRRAAAARQPPARRRRAAPSRSIAEAERFVDALMRDEPVVLFALEWCEFCWSVRKLFAQLGIAYRSVDLDSVAYQAGDRGGRIRAVLAARTGAQDDPADLHRRQARRRLHGSVRRVAQRRGARAARRSSGIAFDAAADLDPYSLLPKWLQPRKSA